MNKLLLTIATLFAYSIIFAQTWNTGTGAWISPLSKNIGIQKSLQVGDNVGTDTLWCKTDLNYFEGNVGIGTITPEAKLHVSSNDTTGIEIAHFENNLGTAIITVHTHSDSSALYGLQTEDFNSALGLSGTTGEVILLTGLGVEAITIDTTGRVTIPDLAGSAQKLVTALADGRLDTASISSISPWQLQGDTITASESALFVNVFSLVPTFIFDLSGQSFYPIDPNIGFVGTSTNRFAEGNFGLLQTESIVDYQKEINTTSSDTATINSIAGRFRKDTSGTTFTITNDNLNSNSIILLTAANASIDVTAITWSVSVSANTAIITFNAAPSSNFDMNFLVIN